MSDKISIKDCTLKLHLGDITDFEVESFVFYAQHNLALGSGYGNAIAVRGGPSIQEELNSLAPLETTQAVISEAGNMKARRIIHAVGPRFQEPDQEQKLKETILNSLKLAEQHDIKDIAFPAMGAGFYGVPLPLCAKVTIDTIVEYLQNGCKLKNVIISLLDNREYKPFQEKLRTLGQG